MIDDGPHVSLRLTESELIAMRTAKSAIEKVIPENSKFSNPTSADLSLPALTLPGILKCDHKTISLHLLAAKSALSKNDRHLIEIMCSDNMSSRLLHEITFCHRFAYYLENSLRCENLGKVIVDLEHNKNGNAEKKLANGIIVRPDIIVHNGKSGEEKENLLVIEAKKTANSRNDEAKIRRMMVDPSFQYKFGAKLIFQELQDMKIKLFWKDKEKIKSEFID